jgi:hypothetical protein
MQCCCMHHLRDLQMKPTTARLHSRDMRPQCSNKRRARTRLECHPLELHASVLWLHCFRPTINHSVLASFRSLPTHSSSPSSTSLQTHIPGLLVAKARLEVAPPPQKTSLPPLPIISCHLLIL